MTENPWVRKSDLDEMTGKYERACVTIAAMHAAAVGAADGGPTRGVVEDVADLRARCLAAEEALGIARARIEGLELEANEPARGE